MPLRQGQVLQNRYRIVKLLGQGGMGAVYRAWDINLNLPIAIKENLDASPAAQKQFSYEANILARLSHPNLTRVTDYFFVAGQGQYLVMDFVEGEDLESMVTKRGMLPETLVLPWIKQVCEALVYLHKQPSPIIHRDIKPANIKIRPDGQAILVDFGIAKVYDAHQVTTVGAKAVTPGYSPPEQYGGSLTDPRSDIYALGATLYRILTGRELPESILRSVGAGTVLPPRQINPQISDPVEKAILKAIDLSVDSRFQNASDFSEALSVRVQQPAYNQPVVQEFVQTIYNNAAPVYPTSAASFPQVNTPLRKPGSTDLQPAARPKWLYWAGGGAIAVCILTVVFLLVRNSINPEVPHPVATTRLSRTTTLLPSETSVPNPTVQPILGTWILNSDWDCSGSPSSVKITFSSDNSFLTSTNDHGRWSLDVSDLTITFDNGNLYSGQFTNQEKSGTMIGTSNLTGCWALTESTATPVPTPITITGEWKFLEDWGCTGNPGVKIITFSRDQTFLTNTNDKGKWNISNADITLYFSDGSIYSGTLTPLEMKGTMVNANANLGCWTAAR